MIVLISYYSFAIIYLYVLIWFWRSDWFALGSTAKFASLCMLVGTFAVIVSLLTKSWGSDDLPNDDVCWTIEAKTSDWEGLALAYAGVAPAFMFTGSLKA